MLDVCILLFTASQRSCLSHLSLQPPKFEPNCFLQPSVRSLHDLPPCGHKYFCAVALELATCRGNICWNCAHTRNTSGQTSLVTTILSCASTRPPCPLFLLSSFLMSFVLLFNLSSMFTTCDSAHIHDGRRLPGERANVHAGSLKVGSAGKATNSEAKTSLTRTPQLQQQPLTSRRLFRDAFIDRLWTKWHLWL